MPKILIAAIAVLSWPALFGFLRVTGQTAEPGQRWADANTGRSELLAATLILWLFALLLTAIWMLTFRVVVPLLEKRRDRRQTPSL
jgi:hypothetical protein